MKESEVVNWLYTETVDVLDTSSLLSLSSPNDHVGLAEKGEDTIYPYVGIQEIANRPQSTGVGSGEVFVDETVYDSQDVLQSITYRRDVIKRVQLIPTTDGDAQLRDDLGGELADHFSVITRQGNLPTDIEALTVEEGTPQDRTDDFVRAHGVPMEITYSRYITNNDPAVADTVNVDIDVTEDVDTAASDDAFNETF